MKTDNLGSEWRGCVKYSEKGKVWGAVGLLFEWKGVKLGTLVYYFVKCNPT
jgi:hypothetical protein